MIIYDLSCKNHHQFEGWFQSAADFDSQLSRHMVCCPQCDSDDVRRIPSAVAIGLHRTEPQVADGSRSSSESGNAVMPAGTQVMALYHQLVKAIAASSEDVGTSFPEEARKIHYNEAPERAIRGQATEDECEELLDEGIQILRMPAIKEEDLN
jgi:hypothetical protein